MHALKEYVMGMGAVLVQITILVLFMDVTKRNVERVAYLATSWAFVIKMENVTLRQIQ